MAGEDILMIRHKELKRLEIIKKVLGKGIKQVESAEILGLSSRQIRRILKRVKLEGDKGVIHQSRGQPSKRRIPDATRDKIVGLYRSEYSDFGPTLASEKLEERDHLRVSDETLRLWLIASGDWKKSRKTRGHRRWRERKAHRGEMVQMDGSHHDWFEGRGPGCVLMSYIDDATGEVLGRFYEYEGTMPAMDSFKRYSRKHGLPNSIYLDRHTTYKSTAKVSAEEIVNDEGPLSEFERALKELGVKVIHATSPQAKGRVERLFKTLQDRLVKEMRLRKLGAIQEANEFLKQYLPVYNRRFSVLPREREDLHRPLPKGFNLDGVLCIKTERTLRNDFTVAHHNKLYQVEDRTRASKVMVHDYINGSLRMTYRDQPLRFKEITTRPIKKQENSPRREQTKRRYIPTPDHPWRGFRYGSHRYERARADLRSQNKTDSPLTLTTYE